jgi:hypothetical protein
MAWEAAPSRKGVLVPTDGDMPKPSDGVEAEHRPVRPGVRLRLGTLILTCAGVGMFALGVGLKANTIVASVLAVVVTAVLAVAVSRLR